MDSLCVAGVSLLFLIRGDLVSLLLMLLLLIFLPISPMCILPDFFRIALCLEGVFLALRFVLQTPLVCQTQNTSNFWILRLEPYCSPKLHADRFQPLFVFSLFKNAAIFISSFPAFFVTFIPVAPAGIVFCVGSPSDLSLCRLFEGERKEGMIMRCIAGISMMSSNRRKNKPILLKRENRPNRTLFPRSIEQGKLVIDPSFPAFYASSPRDLPWKPSSP